VQPRHGVRHVAQAVAQLGDAVQQDEDRDRYAQDELAQVREPLAVAPQGRGSGHLYLMVQPYGVVVAVDTGLPALSSSSAATP
jgi:hypothetical protein